MKRLLVRWLESIGAIQYRVVYRDENSVHVGIYLFGIRISSFYS